MQLLALLRDTRMKTGQYGWGWHSENKLTFTDKPILLDLGLVKLNLSKNKYSSPFDFASDVRLVFENAMLYNPKTDEVHGMAHQLLFYFEMLFRPIQAKLPTNHHVNEFSAVYEFD
ncbi:putative chromatin remodeler Bromodomain family [Helianthus annuus]|uniref:Chromatin remodeler Bromodomain family n=2 Tax=Helianthus annuus TaxID=4232 RepID=A0A9K3NFB5_HELAN|nr:putative chromatin remodeler Bromodomain family [Helianthus annuus]KAJ0549438.1 putative chromatin remodeler Bromodomain family [Helianthus annuus]KAJ0555805.1 putative chromatin remodeler Bromodomain family [Helianthus annuus]KAJ0562393.1 putative chromatin remodeler Bromodomain family [Helianthus annuus]KAJ0727772.1 putative chromatin remodeler Bromodomain family [Helianthus annuus]